MPRDEQQRVLPAFVEITSLAWIHNLQISLRNRGIWSSKFHLKFGVNHQRSLPLRY